MADLQQATIIPVRCARYHRLSAELTVVARAIADGGGDDALELEKEILATFQVHMEVCPSCQAWLKATANIGLDSQERNCDE